MNANDRIVDYDDLRQGQPYGYAIHPTANYLDAFADMYRSRNNRAEPPTGERHPAAAFVNCGRWLYKCPCSCGAAHLAYGAEGLCCDCGARATLRWPRNKAAIEAELLKQPGYRHRAIVRNWEPGWTLADLRERTARAKRMQESLLPHEFVRRMSIGPTRVWASNELLTASNMNTFLTEVLNDLAGRNGPIDLEDSLEIANGMNGNNYLLLPGGTTAQRPASPSNGMMRFNSTLPGVDVFGLTSGAWGNVLDSRSVTAANLRATGGVGLSSTQVAPGVHNHTPTPQAGSFSGIPLGTSPATVTYTGSSPGWWILVVATAPGRNNTRRFASGFIAFDDTSLAPPSRIKIFDSRVSDPDNATEPVRFYPIAASAGRKTITLRQFSNTAATASTTYSNWFYYIAFITLGVTA